MLNFLRNTSLTCALTSALTSAFTSALTVSFALARPVAFGLSLLRQMPGISRTYLPPPFATPAMHTRRGAGVLALAVGGLCALTLVGCAAPGGDARAPAAVVSQLAPSGTLRAAINYGNPILATRDANGALHGISVDLAHALATRLGVPLELVPYTSARQTVQGAAAKAWDVAFVGIDPGRAENMDYTAPYVIIEGVYMVRTDSPITRNDEVDRPGNRIAVSGGSAYDLFLSRQLKYAKLVRGPDPAHVTELMEQQSLEVVAGVKQRSAADAQRFGGLRLLDGNFMVINQAMATLKGRPDGIRYLRTFVEDVKASGFVAQSLAHNHIDGAEVAPAAPVSP